MYYSLIGLLALLVLVIINHDVLFNWSKTAQSSVSKKYRLFLCGVILYYVTDMLWGILDHLKLSAALFIDTEAYFIAMALSIMLWTQYVVAYLEEGRGFNGFLFRSGIRFFITEVVITIMNLYVPILFWFDEDVTYHTGLGRDIMLVVQILMLLLTAIYALITSNSFKDNIQGRRYFTIGMFGIIMATLLTFQFFNPLLPLYSIGYMLGTCLLRTFVIENEKEEYRKELEASLEREKSQFQELISTRQLAYTDALTGVKSKLAYMEKEEQIDKEIADGTKDHFAVIAFDLNALKYTNDTYGHEEGDRLVINAARLICNTFTHSPVFRIGGDEFAAILESQDYDNRTALMEAFNKQTDENALKGEVVVSAGIADYIPGEDNSYDRVFQRADDAMYRRKDELKKRGVYKR